MFRPTRLAVLLVAALAASLGTIAPAHAAVTLDDGHVDGIWVKVVSGNLQGWVGDHTGGGTVERNPADVIFRAGEDAQGVVPPSPNPACQGTAGTTRWLLPQAEPDPLDPNLTLLWLGWSAQSIGSGVVDGNQVTLKLKGVTAPTSGAIFCVFTKSGISTTKIFDSTLAFPQSVAIPVGPTGHRHANWSFTHAGTWTVVFELTATIGGQAKSTGNLNYTFSVG